MGFFSFLVLLAIAYLLWRITDQLPDLIFRMSEIQRDVAEIRRAQGGGATDDSSAAPSASVDTSTAGSGSEDSDTSSEDSSS